MLRDRIRADHVLHTELRFHAAAINVALCAIALDGAYRAWVAGERIPLGGFLHGQGIFGVVAGRDRSRQVVGHSTDDNRLVPTSPRLSPNFGVRKSPNPMDQRAAARLHFFPGSKIVARTALGLAPRPNSRSTV